MKKKIIAFVGGMASGKGFAAEILAEQGYSLYTLSARVKEQLAFQAIPETRESKTWMGNRLREEHGADALMVMTDQLVKEDPNSKIVIDGIRNKGEINFLQREYGKDNVFMIGVEADFELRWERIRKREREGDPKTREEFERLVKIENGEGQRKFGLQVDACMRLADIIIENSTNNPVDLREKLETGIRFLGIEGQTRQKERR